MATTSINTTGNIPTEHRFDALYGFREAAEPGAYVRVEWPHRGGWVEFDNVERIRLSVSGAIHVTATVTRTDPGQPVPGGRPVHRLGRHRT